MGPQAANEPLDDNLDDGGSDQTSQETQRRSEPVICAPPSDLKEGEEQHRDQERDKHRGPQWKNFIPKWVCELWVCDHPIGVEKGE